MSEPQATACVITAPPSCPPKTTKPAKTEKIKIDKEKTKKVKVNKFNITDTIKKLVAQDKERQNNKEKVKQKDRNCDDEEDD